MCALDHIRVQTGIAAYAARIAPETLLKWLDRGQLRLGPTDRESEGSGSARLISLRRCYQIAIAAVIIRLGLPVRTATAIAKRFTDEGNIGRQAGELYPTGDTFLVRIGSSPAVITDERPSPATRAAIAIKIAPILADVTARLASRGVDVAA